MCEPTLSSAVNNMDLINHCYLGHSSSPPTPSLPPPFTLDSCYHTTLCAFLSEATNMSNHFVKIILSQGHLSPPSSCYDYTLGPYPLPDLVVIGDKSGPFTVTSSNYTVINPGSFLGGSFELKVHLKQSEMPKLWTELANLHLKFMYNEMLTFSIAIFTCGL